MTHSRSAPAARGGFTLVEMLVATTLVVMMMLMFAQIYVAAIGSLGEQQAVSRNDGKARLADTLIRADLRRMTFQSAPGSNQGLLPLVNGDSVDEWQSGYFYLSENDQTNPVDDVLQFTTRITGKVRNPDQSTYFGRCRDVDGVLELDDKTLPVFPYEYSNHPDLDDGDAGNGVGASRAAEVSYFVRNGNLYRRVLLLRDVDLQAGGLSTPAQPSNPANSTEFATRIIPDSGAGNPSFYKAFDYAAYCRVNDFSDASLDVIRFIGTDSLENRPDAIDGIGRSMNRFGFAMLPGNQTVANTDLVLQAIMQSRGQPVEYDSLGNFFGRPVHAETGSYEWGWPGTRFNPLLDADLKYGVVGTDQLSYQAGNIPLVDTVVDPSLTNYTRATEDLLVSNVESFDVEVWDPGLMEDYDNDGAFDAGMTDLNGNGFADQAGGFVQLGHSGPTGYFRDLARRNAFYGPGTDPNGVNANISGRNWVFDTGHPDMWTEAPKLMDAPFTTYGSDFRPAYRPLMYRAVDRDVNRDNIPDPTEDFNGIYDVNCTEDRFVNGLNGINGILDPGEDTDGDSFLDLNEDRNGNGVLDPSEDLNGNSTLDPGEDTDGDGVLDLSEDRNGNGILDLTEDLNSNGIFDPAPINPVRAANQWYPDQLYPYSEDLNSNGTLDPGEDDNRNGILDTLVNVVFRPGDKTQSIAYRCVSPGRSGTSAVDWPTVPGQRTRPGGDGTVIWEAFDNRVGLQKIRITLRLRDPIEGLPRQFSIVHTFANPK